jgi:hypothetical protein
LNRQKGKRVGGGGKNLEIRYLDAEFAVKLCGLYSSKEILDSEDHNCAKM